MRSRFILRICLYLIFPFFVGLIFYKMISGYLLEPIEPSDKSMVLVDIEPSSTFSGICKKLEEQGLIKHWRVLDIVGRLRGSAVQIKAGEYAFNRTMSPVSIFEHLISGMAYKRHFVIKPGMNVYNMANAIQLAGITTSNKFLDAVKDANLLVRAGLQSKSFEGYLEAGEYYFSKNARIDNIIWELFEKAEKKWTIEFQARSRELNMSRNEIITVASILQKEVLHEKQYELFASLIYNRIKYQRKLELEQTLRYSLRNYMGKISDSLKSSRNTFNTFENFGLPSGPICTPSDRAVRAALYPANSQFLDFDRGPNGQIIFK